MSTINSILRWTALAPMLLLAACASSAPVREFQYQSRSPVPPGMALVYFYRESSFLGGGLNMKMHDGDKIIGTLENGSYFVVPMTPGLHNLTPMVRDPDSIRGVGNVPTLEAGKIYAFRAYFSSDDTSLGAAMTGSGRIVTLSVVEPSLAFTKMTSLDKTDDTSDF